MDKPAARELDRRIGLITGASAGIGRAIALEFARRGARLVINARRAEKLDEVAREINAGSRASGMQCAASVVGDAVEQSTIDAMFAAARREFGAPVDLVIVNAGRGLSGSVTTSDTAQWEEMIRTNLLGAARLMRSAAEALLSECVHPDGESGMTGPWLSRPRDIVVLGSTVGRHISPFSSMYGSTKFAVNSLAEAMRREVGPKGVRVTLIEPAIVATEFQGVAGYDMKEGGAFASFMRRIGPVLDAEDVADAIAYVVSRPAHVHINDVVMRPTRQEYP